MSSSLSWQSRKARNFLLKPPPTHSRIFSLRGQALHHITSIRSLDRHDHILRFHHALTTFCFLHRDVGITLTWSPVNRNRASDSTARATALEAYAQAP